ncbi:hypothetical protein K458DRAFT_433284 [Lentithecium fluviatile CBS 122367]|uniref:Uncharacterized protein n=1 Tax=Lentithecium fluviatile CBS 122367 TaxID=1168545 RepID=A0A6G1IUU2_9PLEO|nr:hypothetical protein K458DRAFT_433284 [Lentithecium fluviatile CBS 122367]
MSHDAATPSNHTITYLLLNSSYFFTMDITNAHSSRATSPFDNNYESYENTRENARGERLLNEYKDTVPLVVNSRRAERRPGIAPHTNRIISRIRLSLRLLSLFVSASILALLAHILSMYLKTKDEWVTVEERYGTRRVWPHWLKMKPTFMLMGVAATTTLFSLMLVFAMCSRKVRHVSTFSNTLTAFFCLICVSLWTAVGFYHRFYDLKGNSPSDVMSYVCGNGLHPLIAKRMGDTRIMCQEMRYAWWAVLLVTAIEVGVVATVGWGVMATSKKGKYVRVI